MNKLKLVLSFLVILSISSCSSISKPKKDSDSVSWYKKPKQNDLNYLYGIGQASTMEEATKYALVDAASRLITTISSETNLLREEDRNDANEEMRQHVKQNIEKITFTNYRITRSDLVNGQFFTEVEIEKLPFINEQKERVAFLEKQVSDMEAIYLKKGPLQKKFYLSKILDLEKEIELKSRVLAGLGEEPNLKTKLDKVADYQNQFNAITDKFEFYISASSSKEISRAVSEALNKSNITVSPDYNGSNPSQISLRIKSTSKTDEIYDSYITKLKVSFESITNGKTVASNSVEVTGNSAISGRESYYASIKNLEGLIEKDGVLNILGIK